MQRYRTKRSTVEAMQYHGSEDSHLFLGKCSRSGDYHVTGTDFSGNLILHTPEDIVYIRVGDWLVRTANGDLESCPEGEFHDRYERFL